MPLLFSYGTLRDPATQLAVFGRRLAGSPDELPGFARRVITIDDSAFAATNGATHTIVRQTGRDEDRTEGTALEVTDAELQVADAYEPAGYVRVEVRFASGRRGWVYADTASADKV